LNREGIFLVVGIRNASKIKRNVKGLYPWGTQNYKFPEI